MSRWDPLAELLREVGFRRITAQHLSKVIEASDLVHGGSDELFTMLCKWRDRWARERLRDAQLVAQSRAKALEVPRCLQDPDLFYGRDVQ